MGWGAGTIRLSHVMVIGALVIGAGGVASVSAHETDNFTMPPERPFADWGPIWTRIVHRALEHGVAYTNERIRRAQDANLPEAYVERLRRPEMVQWAIRRAFPPTLTLIDDIDRLVATEQARRRFPGKLPSYQPFEYIYSYSSFPLDPRQVFKLWRARHMKVHGVHLGSDKIGHFFTKGDIYYRMYRDKLRAGMSREEAIEAVVAVGVSGDVFLSEKRMLGYWSSGVLSHADLAADYLGLKFYMNLTEPVRIAGRTQPPMLEWVDGYWRLAEHVRRDTDFFSVYISDHLNEALNPNLMEPFMRQPVRRQIERGCAPLLDRYSDRFGNRRSHRWFDHTMRELSTYFGVSYGHRKRFEEMVTIADVCFPEHAFKDVHDRCPLGRTALHQAAVDGDAPRVRELLVRDEADPNVRVRSKEETSSEWGDRPLHFASREGHAQVVRLLLAHGADVNAANDRGVTPMHRATQVGGPVFEVLLGAGADVRTADERGRTPLHWAATYPRLDVIAQLIDAGADVYARDHDQRTPMHYAAQWGQWPVIDLLAEAGADIEAPATFGVTPLFVAARHGEAEAVARLLGLGAAGDAADETGRTPLHVAAAHMHSAVGETLIAGGASVNAADAFGSTPLHEAARRNNTYLIDVLVEAGADADAADRFERTPMHVAAMRRHAAAMERLVAHGGDRFRPDRDGRTPHALFKHAPLNLVDHFMRLGAYGPGQ